MSAATISANPEIIPNRPHLKNQQMMIQPSSTASFKLFHLIYRLTPMELIYMYFILILHDRNSFVVMYPVKVQSFGVYMPTTKCWRLEHVLLTHSFYNYYSVAFAFVSPFICMLRGEFLMYTVLLIFRTEILHSDKFSYVLETAQPLQIINRFHENFYKKY
jgi:hypothetical protein